MRCFAFRILERNGGRSIPLTFKQFMKVMSEMEPPPKPAKTLDSKAVGKADTPIADDHEQKFGIPALVDLGEVAFCIIKRIISV